MLSICLASEVPSKVVGLEDDHLALWRVLARPTDVEQAAVELFESLVGALLAPVERRDGPFVVELEEGVLLLSGQVGDRGVSRGR